MQAEQTTQTLARFAYDCFETAHRSAHPAYVHSGDEDGDAYVRVIEGAPGWVTDLCHHAHGEMFPDDWRYRAIRDALEAIMEADDLDDAGAEYADGMVDVYTGARLAWLSSNLNRVGYCDDAQDEYGSEDQSVTALIGQGQYQEASEVFGLVRGFLEKLEQEPRTDSTLSGDDSAGTPDHNRA